MSIDSTNRVDGLALALAPASSKVGTPSPMWWGLARLGQRVSVIPDRKVCSVWP